MPAPKRVAWAQLRVGIMAIVAMVLLVMLIFLLTGSKNLFVRETVLYTYLEDSAALSTGAPVRLNGFLVGSLSEIALTGSTDPNKIVRLSMQVREDMLTQIPVDSQTSISAENVLGTKYINIRKGRSPQHVKPGATLPSLDTREFEEVVQSGYALLTSLQGLVQRIDKIVGLVETGQGSIGRLLVDDELYNRLLAIERDLQRVSGALASREGTIGKLLYDDTLYQEIRTPVARLDSLLDDLQRGEGTAGKLLKDPSLYKEFQSAVGEVNQIVAQLNAGKGTMGKLLKDEALYRELNRTVDMLNGTLERVNSGQGTLGQLVVNPQLYESLNGLMRESNGLIKDFRSNPKKFLRIKLALF